MTTYRVERDGETVWSDETDNDDAHPDHFPAEWLARPKDGSPHVLFINDEIVGVQQSHADEKAGLLAQADQFDAAGDKRQAATYRLLAARTDYDVATEGN